MGQNSWFELFLKTGPSCRSFLRPSIHLFIRWYFLLTPNPWILTTCPYNTCRLIWSLQKARRCVILRRNTHVSHCFFNWKCVLVVNRFQHQIAYHRAFNPLKQIYRSSVFDHWRLRIDGVCSCSRGSFVRDLLGQAGICLSVLLRLKGL